MHYIFWSIVCHTKHDLYMYMTSSKYLLVCDKLLVFIHLLLVYILENVSMQAKFECIFVDYLTWRNPDVVFDLFKHTQSWSETPPSFNTHQEKTDLFFLSVILTSYSSDKSKKESAINDKCWGNFEDIFWEICFWTDSRTLCLSWLFILETIVQKVKVKFILLELKQSEWLHYLKMIFLVPCVLTS